MVKFWDNGIGNGSGEVGVVDLMVFNGSQPMHWVQWFQWLESNHWCQWNGNGFPSIELDETSMVFNGSPLLVLLTIVQV